MSDKKQDMHPALNDEKPDLENSIDSDSAELFDDLPEEVQKTVRKRIMSFQMSGMMPGPEMHIAQKITEEHITQFLEASREESRNEYTDRKNKRVFQLLSFILVVAFVIVIIVLLKNKPEILEKVLYAGGGIVAGAFGGYGYGKSKSGSD